MRFIITEAGIASGAADPCTSAFQRMIDRCHEAGGGVVVVPAGVFTTGTLRLRSRVRIELEPGARLLGSPRLEDYSVQPTPRYRSLKDQTGFRALIYAEGEEDVALGGDGIIDGQGEVFPFGGSDGDGRPRLIQLVSCRGVKVEGLSLRNSGLWMQHYLDCERVSIRGLRVWNHANRNNDMLDIDGCRGVTVSDCQGDTDDDGITLKSTGPAPCEDVVITNCVIRSRCNAIKCGTESTGGFRNIAISNCVVRPSAAPSGIYGHPEGISGISLELVDGGVLEDVSISHVLIEGTRSPIFIRLGDRGRPHLADGTRPGVGKLRRVTLSHIHARNTGQTGSSITGLPGHPVEDVSLFDVSLRSGCAGREEHVNRELSERAESYPEATMWGPLPAHGLWVRHARRLALHRFRAEPAPGEPRPALRLDDVEEVDADAPQP